MALSHSTTVRNDMADAVDARINTGAGTAVFELLDGATVCASFNLQDPAHGAAASGVITLQGTPLTDASADNTGTLDGFQIKDQDGNVHISGSLTGSGGGGDLEADSVSVTAGQQVDLTSFTWTAPS